jgi:hypothetical protein
MLSEGRRDNEQANPRARHRAASMPAAVVRFETWVGSCVGEVSDGYAGRQQCRMVVTG